MRRWIVSPECFGRGMPTDGAVRRRCINCGNSFVEKDKADDGSDNTAGVVG